MINKHLTRLLALLTVALSSMWLHAEAFPLEISALRWNPDGTTIAVGVGTDPTNFCLNAEDVYAIRLIDPLSGSVVKILKSHTCSIRELAFHSDGTRLASVAPDGLTIIWDVNNSDPFFVGQSMVGMDGIDWQPFGNSILEIRGAFSVAISDTAANLAVTNSYLVPRGIHTDDITDAKWNGDGTHIVSSSIDGTVRAWNAETRDTLSLYQGHNVTPVYTVSWSHPNNIIASGDASGVIHIWNPTNAANIFTLTGDTGAVNIVRWSPDGAYLASGGDDGTVRVWDGATGAQVGLLTYPGAVLALDWSPDSTELVYGGRRSDGQDAEIAIDDAPGVDQDAATPTPTSAGNTATPTFTPTVTLTPTLTPTSTPPPTTLITNITAVNGKAYARDSVAVGTTLYIDRIYSFVSFPSTFAGQDFIRTANDDKQLTTANFLSFDLTADAWVYVLYDSRFSPPAWLATWLPTGESVITTEFNNTELARNVYRKRYAAGSVTLPGNSGANNYVMYNVVAIPDPVNKTSLYRVNAGGGQVVSGNVTWAADGYVTGGRGNTLASGNILNTADDVLYYTERSADPPGSVSFTYDFPVTNGTYSVRLHFAETWWTGVSGSRPSGTGRRVFDVQIEGVTVLDDYDITASAGAPLTADVHTFSGIVVSDGSLTVHFPPASVDHPSVSAIEVFAVP